MLGILNHSRLPKFSSPMNPSANPDMSSRLIDPPHLAFEILHHYQKNVTVTAAKPSDLGPSIFRVLLILLDLQLWLQHKGAPCTCVRESRKQTVSDLPQKFEAQKVRRRYAFTSVTIPRSSQKCKLATMQPLLRVVKKDVGHRWNS